MTIRQEGDAARFIELEPSFVDTAWFNLERIYNELKSDQTISALPNKPLVQSRHGAELALRNATNGFRDTMERIDEALAKRRSDPERALLRSIRDQVAILREDSRIVLHRLYSEVESISK